MELNRTRKGPLPGGTGTRANEEYIGRGDCGNTQYASRKSTATSPLIPKQAESGCHERSEPNAGYLFGSQQGPLRDGLNFLFGAALAVCRIIGAKISKAGHATGQSSAIPAWRIRIEERIAKARTLIGRPICFRSGNTRPRIVHTVRMAFAGINVSFSQPDIVQKLTERIDDLKQRIAAWEKRIRRYIERSTRFNQNRLFQSDQKRLYKSLEQPIVSGTGPAPNQADTVVFWRSLWSKPVKHNEGPWTEVVAKPNQMRKLYRYPKIIIIISEAIPSSNELATIGDAAPQATDQLPRVEAAVDLPVVVDSDDDEMVSHELEQMRSILEEAILETRSMPLENRPRLPRIPLSKRSRAVVRALNPILVTFLEASRDLCETDSVLFGAAVAACRIIGAKIPMAGRATKQSSAIPVWRKRIEDRIAKARALIGRQISFRSGNNRPRVVRTVRMAFAGTNISLSQPDISQKLTERIDDLKQKIAAWGKRIRRFTERSKRFNQNPLFQSDQKRLYKSLERPEVYEAGPGPDQANTVAFWRGLWSEPVNHSEGPWMEVVANDDGIVSHELEKIRSILEELMLETRSMPLENRPRLPRISLSKRNRAVVRALNPILVTYLEASWDLCETDLIFFGAALAVCRIIGAKLPMAGRATTK
ncbi:unnamed protein product [Parnassius apollo]|uniref:(apollo) hypothetical protein n=1 Tax=Parnassius apollo TaxID=110799 RepID=A0A8S3W1J5_PARAO|nr:unnamed protein product [Parnassius apollo]